MGILSSRACAFSTQCSGYFLFIFIVDYMGFYLFASQIFIPEFIDPKEFLRAHLKDVDRCSLGR